MINRSGIEVNKGFFNRLNIFNVCFSLGVFIVFDSIRFLKKKIGFSDLVKKQREIYEKRSTKNKLKIMSHVFIVLVSFVACNSQFQFDIIEAPIGSEILKYEVPLKLSIPEGFESIRIAANNWNTVLGRELFCKDCEGYPVEVRFVDSLEEITHHDELNHAAITLHEESRCLIYFRNHSDSFHYEELQVATHELGHCVGFQHSTFERSLMYPILGNDINFTTEIVRLTNGA